MRFVEAVEVEHTSCIRTHLSADTVSKKQNLITKTKIWNTKETQQMNT